MSDDLSGLTTADLIDCLERDDAEGIFESEVDPDGPFRYTGEFDGWWRGLRMVIDGDREAESRIRKACLEALA